MHLSQCLSLQDKHWWVQPPHHRFCPGAPRVISKRLLACCNAPPATRLRYSQTYDWTVDDERPWLLAAGEELTCYPVLRRRGLLPAFEWLALSPTPTAVRQFGNPYAWLGTFVRDTLAEELQDAHSCGGKDE